MIRILFLASNPLRTGRLDLEREARSIKERLRAADHAADFQILQEESLRVRDLTAAFLRHKPHIVHFSGHGDESGALIVQTDSGQTVPLDKDAVAALFAEFSSGMRCVVLNACYSETQAREIARSVDCVVGMSDPISDESAISFAAAFYQTLGFGESVGRAYRLGKIEAGFAGASDRNVPQLLTRAGVDADTVNFLPS